MNSVAAGEGKTLGFSGCSIMRTTQDETIKRSDLDALIKALKENSAPNHLKSLHNLAKRPNKAETSPDRTSLEQGLHREQNPKPVSEAYRTGEGQTGGETKGKLRYREKRASGAGGGAHALAGATCFSLPLYFLSLVLAGLRPDPASKSTSGCISVSSERERGQIWCPNRHMDMRPRFPRFEYCRCIFLYSPFAALSGFSCLHSRLPSMAVFGWDLIDGSRWTRVSCRLSLPSAHHTRVLHPPPPADKSMCLLCDSCFRRKSLADTCRTDAMKPTSLLDSQGLSFSSSEYNVWSGLHRLQTPNIVQAPNRMTGSSIHDTHLSGSSQSLLPPLAQRPQQLNRPPHSQFPVQQSSKQPFSQIPQPGVNPPPRSQVKGLSETAAPFQRQKQVVPASNAIQPSQVPRPPLTKSAMQQGGQMASLNYGKRINNEGPHESIDRPSKMMRVDDRRNPPFHTGHASNSMLPNPLQLQEKAPQALLSPDVQSTLLQQVMNLTPDQLRMLTPEQQQEVVKLQQALKQQDHVMQPS
ncbi:hypothetical protein F2Q70_00015922 [Brassica cretica]|uniref:Transcription termination and cleavage factor C-terminal domain-containing protein n=1 Tax=Brassica cretica TaxID=69181 RepID=A0A8S9HQ14_BRACR|nr:hypothetical protein F2Q70_00015922 [Brassica cretica]